MTLTVIHEEFTMVKKKAPGGAENPSRRTNELEKIAKDHEPVPGPGSRSTNSIKNIILAFDGQKWYGQTDMAREVGVQKHTMWKILNEDTKLVSPHILVRMADILGVSIRWLFDDSVPIEPIIRADEEFNLTIKNWKDVVPQEWRLIVEVMERLGPEETQRRLLGHGHEKTPPRLLGTADLGPPKKK